MRRVYCPGTLAWQYSPSTFNIRPNMKVYYGIGISWFMIFTINTISMGKRRLLLDKVNILSFSADVLSTAQFDVLQLVGAPLWRFSNPEQHQDVDCPW